MTNSKDNDYYENDEWLDAPAKSWVMFPGQTNRQQRDYDRRKSEEIKRMRANQVVLNGRLQCPGGCDPNVGGCIIHSDPC